MKKLSRRTSISSERSINSSQENSSLKSDLSLNNSMKRVWFPLVMELSLASEKLTRLTALLSALRATPTGLMNFYLDIRLLKTMTIVKLQQ
jgi:hypothetical protein